VLITSSRQSAADLGIPVGVEAFTPAEALAYLAGRTGLADPDGAAKLAKELGCLPLALAQASAVIRGQHLPYETYLERLRALPVGDYLTRRAGQPYTHGVAEAVLLSLQAVQAADAAGACAGVTEMMAVLSAAGVRRDLLHAAGRAGVLTGGGDLLDASAVDEALGRLAEWSLLDFSVDGQTVIAHRLVLRVVRDILNALGRLVEVLTVAADFLDARAAALQGSWDSPAFGHVIDQMEALFQNAAEPAHTSVELQGALMGLHPWVAV
jgi:hypothetical protein